MGRKVDISGSCAIVTGASGGIGSCLAMELAGRGCDLILVDLREDRLFKTADEISRATGVYIYTLPLDLTAEDVAERMEAFCRDTGADPDILVNNAGIFSFDSVAHTDVATIGRFIHLHIHAVTVLSRWFVSRRIGKKSGWILNMSSMSCWMPMPGLAMYASTKAYIRVFSRSLHYEVKDLGIGVTVACPGGIATDLFGLPENLKNLAVTIRVLDAPDRFARKAIEKMLHKKKQYINGWLNRISIFLVGISPTSIRMMVKHQLLDKGIKR